MRSRDREPFFSSALPARGFGSAPPYPNNWACTQATLMFVGLHNHSITMIKYKWVDYVIPRGHAKMWNKSKENSSRYTGRNIWGLKGRLFSSKDQKPYLFFLLKIYASIFQSAWIIQLERRTSIVTIQEACLFISFCPHAKSIRDSRNEACSVSLHWKRQNESWTTKRPSTRKPLQDGWL